MLVTNEKWNEILYEKKYEMKLGLTRRFSIVILQMMRFFLLLLLN